MKKRFVLCVMILSLVLFCFPTYAIGGGNHLLVGESALVKKMETGEYFTADVAKNALLKVNKTANELNVLKKISLPSSMDIQVPRIDPSKIIREDDRVIGTMENNADFVQALEEHGITEDQYIDMSMNEYRALEDTWRLTETQVDIYKKFYPDLENVDISRWTNEQMREYSEEQDLATIKRRFKGVQLAQLYRRGIQDADLFYLFKEYHTPETILAQSDAELKNTLEIAYISLIDLTFGGGTYMQYKEAQLQNLELMNVDVNELNAMDTAYPNYTLPSHANGYYEWVYYPKYGNDYFSNSVTTSAAWIEVRVQRAFATKGLLYRRILDESEDLNCTNMYGTYSQSSGGAHEGLDYNYGGAGRYVYSPVEGTRIDTEDHRVFIYTGTYNNQTVNQTYSFHHFSSRSQNTGQFTLGQYLGVQGAEGNATGAHVHFEVHSGRTTSLCNAGDNHTVESLSPYQLQIFYE
ncbi:MAG: hypothetical protein IJO92_01155 [Clostridia bacterium]|nr:hypothetical protein [Clostridia bacterium]